MVDDDPRAFLDRLIVQSGDDYAGLSKLVGRNAAYIQQYIKRGTPKRLPEIERGILARYFGVDERLLGGVAAAASKPEMRLIPKLAVGASAGPGALNDAETLAEKSASTKNGYASRGWSLRTSRSFASTAIRWPQRSAMAMISWSTAAWRPQGFAMAFMLSGWMMC